ncbi:pilus assembly PilX family protein [Massilia sp. DD77]|uniref:pilus assembly PilX family protein n=1 Tax=Massilia sp. DD77 TaxID=3109349 RepID=UPI002FFECFF2
MHPPTVRKRKHERGAALLTAMVLMLAVLMTGLAGARTALYGARAAAHERDRLLALQMAEAALADAERDIEGGDNPASARAAAFAAGLASAFAQDCTEGRPYDGLCQAEEDVEEHAQRLADDDGPAVRFGAFTGRRMPEGEGGLPSEAPRYLIERMPAAGTDHLYRITALGTGSMPTTRAAVQAYYRKPATAGTRGRRVGWREIGNWAGMAASE